MQLNLPAYLFKIKQTDNGKKIYDELRHKYVALTPEEWIRQHFVTFLYTEKKYPKSLMANEVALSLNNTKRRCDTIVYDMTATPLVIVEYKAPTVDISQAVFDQIVRYNMVLHAKYLIVSNGINHYCCKIDYSNHSYVFLPEIPSYNEL